MAADQARAVSARSSGWTASSQPEPLSWSNVWPVNSVQPGCSASNWPDAGVFQTIAAVASIRDRNRSSPRRKASSASLRLMSWPTWLPMAVRIWRSSSSGCWISPLKTSTTPRMSRPTTTGKPSAPCSPSRAAACALGKLGSLTTSGIQADWPLAQTRPGSPTPRANVVCRLRATNSSGRDDGECHRAPQRSTSACGSTRHRAPSDQPRLSQIARRSAGTASSSRGDPARASDAVYWTSRRRSARPRSRSMRSSDAAFHQISAVKRTMLASTNRDSPIT